MSTDFLAGISEALLNKAVSDLFPALKPKFGGTSTIRNPAATVTWGVAAPPVFVLGSAASTSFEVKLKLSVAVTPEGGSETAETVDATAQINATISGTGALGLDVSDISFAVSDPFLLAVMNAKKQEIGEQVDDLLSKVEIPVGPIEGVTFGGHGVGVLGGALYAAGGLSEPVPITPRLDTGSGFQVMLSEAAILQLVRTQWWDKAKKSFSASGATVHIKGYSAAVDNGKLVLTLNMGGSYHWGKARWDVRISKVVVKMDFTLRSGDQLWLDKGSVNSPNVSLHPANVGAWFATIALGPVIATIQLIFQSKLPGEIESKLGQKVFTVPTLTESFDGVGIVVTPTGVSAKGSGNNLLISGGANFSTS